MSSFVFAQIAQGTGDEIVERLKLRARHEWAELPPEGAEAVKSAAQDLSELLLRKAAGQKVDAELELVEATLANWGWVGASLVRTALLEEAKEVAAIVGGALRKIIVGLL